MELFFKKAVLHRYFSRILITTITTVVWNMKLTEHFFSITLVTVSSKSEVFIKNIFSQFEDTGGQQLMHSHFFKKFLKERLHFSGCWLFLKKWNNESIVISITPPYIFNSPVKVYKKKLYLYKILAIFQMKSPHYNKERGFGQKPCTNIQ